MMQFLKGKRCHLESFDKEQEDVQVLMYKILCTDDRKAFVNKSLNYFSKEKFLYL